MNANHTPIGECVHTLCADPAFREGVERFLAAMCEVDTTPRADIGLMKAQEDKVFATIREYLTSGKMRGSAFENRRISPDIQNHQAFSKLFFTQTRDCPEGLPAEEVYRERSNLLFFLDGKPGSEGLDTAVNAHIDVVAPFFPPGRQGERVYGRGVVDDKGNVAAICGALRLIRRLSDEGHIHLKNRITAMFVVEEETGGNGSLALATDRELKERYDSILVMECAGNNIYPANRGAVWFKCSAGWRVEKDVYAKGTLLEALAFAVLAMHEEGQTIRTESDHPLFPHRPVQTCNGILGPFGEHPSRICGKVSFTLHGVGNAKIREEIDAAMEAGLNAYIDACGDKTRVMDPLTGKNKVERHLEITQGAGRDLLITVYGSTGHMGAILENDDAVLKWAFLVREVVKFKIQSKADIDLELTNFDATENLVLEGGQGFLPSHRIEDIQERVDRAFGRGLRAYLECLDLPCDAITYSATFDKLHNSAFDGDPDSPTMRNALAAGRAAGIADENAPVRGWDVSCDARLFACEYPAMPVITSGVGELRCAHADDENLYLPDLWKAIHFCTLFLLKETGSLPSRSD